MDVKGCLLDFSQGRFWRQQSFRRYLACEIWVWTPFSVLGLSCVFRVRGLSLLAAPASIGLSALIHLFYDIGDNAGNIICIQQLDDMRDLISLLDGQLTVTRAFEDADTVFFQQPQGRV
jgi:hypothetical protein